jgi:glycosyltransferase involved in cell wall biosynthesis
VVVPPTRPDLFPSVVIGAMGDCRAVECSRLGGIREMIDNGATGRFVGPGSWVDLAHALGFLLGDRERAIGMRQAGLDRARAEFPRAAVAGHASAVRTAG